MLIDFLAGLAIPDVSGIHTGRVRYLSSSYKIVVLGLVSREFRRRSGVPTVGSPGMGREFRHGALRPTWRVHCPGHTGHVRYAYRTCPVWMTRSQRLVSKAVRVGSSDVSREFRRSGVPTYVGSSDTSLTLTLLHVFQIC